MNAVHYANDITMYVIVNWFNSLIRKGNFDIGKKDYWLCANKLYFNTSESQCYMFSNIYYNDICALRVGGHFLPQCSHTKLLGIFY